METTEIRLKSLVTITQDGLSPATYRIVAVNSRNDPDELQCVRMYQPGTHIRRLPLSWLKKSLETGEAHIEQTDPIFRNVTQPLRSKAKQDVLEARWRALEPYTSPETISEFLDQNRRRALCQRIAEDTKRRWQEATECIPAPVKPFHLSAKHACDLLTQFLQGGLVKEALAPRYDHCGRPRSGTISPVKRGRPRLNANVGPGMILTNDDKRKVSEAVDKLLLICNGPHKSVGIQDVIRLVWPDVPFQEGTGFAYANTDGKECPSIRQISRFIQQQYPRVTIIRKRLGSRRADNEIGTQTGADHGVHPLGLGAQYAVDASKTGWAIMNADPTKPAETYWLYFVTDIATRMIVGFHICVQHEAADLKVALYRAFTSKLGLLAAYRCPVRQSYLDVVGVPEQVLGDRGEELSVETEVLMEQFRKVGIRLDLENAPAYSGFRKGWVESDFACYKRFVQDAQLPGLNPAHEFDVPRRALQPCLTMESAVVIVCDYINYHNAKIMRSYQLSPEMVKDKVRKTPEGLAQWTLANYPGALQSVDVCVLQRFMLPSASLPVTRRGLEWHGHVYIPEGSRNPLVQLSAPAARIMEMSRESAARLPQHLTAYYDPLDISRIYAAVDDVSDLVPCVSADSSLLPSPTPLITLEQQQRAGRILADAQELEDAAYRTQLKEHITSTIDHDRHAARAAGRLAPGPRTAVPDDAAALSAATAPDVVDAAKRNLRDESLDWQMDGESNETND
jgi:hypothetical protein